MQGSWEQTAAIVRGTSQIAPEFREAAASLSRDFGVPVFNITTGKVASAGRVLLRLEVWVRTRDEEQQFRDANSNFDKAKQDVVKAALNDVVVATRRVPESLFDRRRMTPKDTFVVFLDFDSPALEALDREHTQADLDALMVRLDNPDLWAIRSLSGSPSFLVYTKKQVERYRDSEEFTRWVDSYVALLAEHDEFQVADLGRQWARLESKERFESDYDGNWYYFFL
jgi:hypothetical protein